MRTLLVGGGKVGSFLARELVSGGHAVTVMEPDEARAQAIADELDAVIIRGDGTNVRLLQDADCYRTDWMVAVTGKDEVNLVACQLGLTLGVKRVIARLNNPLNEPTFSALGIPVVGVTDIMVKILARELDTVDLGRVAVIGRGQVSVCEFDIPATFAPSLLRETALPAPTVIALVMRGDEVMVPSSETELRGGDRIVAVTTVEQERALHDTFVERNGRG